MNCRTPGLGALALSLAAIVVQAESHKSIIAFAPGPPIANVDVNLKTRHAPTSRVANATGHTRANGEITFPGVKPGTYTIVLTIQESLAPNAKSFFESRSNTVRLQKESGGRSWLGFDNWPYLYSVNAPKLVRTRDEIRRSGNRVQIEEDFEISGAAPVPVTAAVNRPNVQ